MVREVAHPSAFASSEGSRTRCLAHLMHFRVSQKVAGTAHDEAGGNSDNLTSAIMFLSEDVDIGYAENYFHFWLLIKESGLDGTVAAHPSHYESSQPRRCFYTTARPLNPQMKK